MIDPEQDIEMEEREDIVPHQAKPKLHVTMINRRQEFALLDNGCIVPVTNWFGTNGDDCSPAEAAVCVAGDKEFGWFTIDLQKFDHVTVH